MIERPFRPGEIEIHDAGTKMVDRLRSLTLSGRRHGDVVGTEFDVVAKAGFLLQNRAAEDTRVEMGGFFGVIDGQSEVIECAEAEGSVGGKSGAGGKNPGGERGEGLPASGKHGHDPYR